MRRDSEPRQIEHVVERIERLFYRALVIEQMFFGRDNVVGVESLQAVEFFITLYI